MWICFEWSRRCRHSLYYSLSLYFSLLDPLSLGFYFSTPVFSVMLCLASPSTTFVFLNRFEIFTGVAELAGANIFMLVDRHCSLFSLFCRIFLIFFSDLDLLMDDLRVWLSWCFDSAGVRRSLDGLLSWREERSREKTDEDFEVVFLEKFRSIINVRLLFMNKILLLYIIIKIINNSV